MAYITTDGSGGGDQSGNVTLYSEQVESWSTSGYNDITLSNAAKSDMENYDFFYIALINYDYDLLDIDIGSGSAKNGLYYQNNTGTSKDPYINYTTTAAAAVTHNATFFGANF